MQTNTKRLHRHIVAVPMVLSLCAVIAGTGSIAIATADVTTALLDRRIEAGAEDMSFSLEDGTVGQLSATAVLEVQNGRPELRTGGALVASKGILWLHVGDAALLGFGGGMYVHRGDRFLTISALSTPVLLRRGGFTAFVPQGKQVSWDIGEFPSVSDHLRTLSLVDDARSIDPTFHRETLEAMSRIAVSGPVNDPTISTTLLSAGTSIFDLLRLPSARERSARGSLSQSFDELASLVAKDDTPGIRSFLSEPGVAEFLRTSPEGVPRLAAMLEDAADHPGMVLELLPYLSDPDLQLLASLHPALRAAAWVSDERAEGDGEETKRLSLLLFPVADTLPEPAPEIAVRRWADAVASALRSADDSKPVLDELFASMHRFISIASRLGYPDRMERLVTSLEDAIHASSAELTDWHRQLLLSWHAMSALPVDIAIRAQEAAPAPENALDTASGSTLEDVLAAFGAAPSQETTPVTSEQAFAIAESVKNALQSAGALLTVRTSMEVLGADRVTVTDIVFSSQTGDHFFSFEFQPSTGSLSGIVKDGSKLPFGMTLGDFTGWVRGE